MRCRRRDKGEGERRTDKPLPLPLPLYRHLGERRTDNPLPQRPPGGPTRFHLSTTINSHPAGSRQALSTACHLSSGRLLSTDKWQALVHSLPLVATIGVSGMRYFDGPALETTRRIDMEAKLQANLASSTVEASLLASSTVNGPDISPPYHASLLDRRMPGKVCTRQGVWFEKQGVCGSKGKECVVAAAALAALVCGCKA